MRIIFLTQYYPPETGAAQNRLADLARRLSNAGHHITVLTAMPSYPKGEIYPEYQGRMGLEENDAGIQIVRTWIYATKRKNFVPRILNYLSFAVLSTVVGWRTIDKADVVFVESPPLFVGVVGYLLSKLKSAKFVLNISDLWPESAVALGVLRNQRLIRWVTKMEEWLYRGANLVTGQTQGIVSSIQRRSPNTPVHLLTNGVSPEFLAAAAEASTNRERVRSEFGVAGKFVVGFAGLHGLVYGLDAVLRAASLLAEHNEIHFLLIGDGPEKQRLQEEARRLGLVNVSFYATLPVERMPEIFTAMDVVLIALRGHDLFKGTLPSKLFEAMGAAVPVVAALKGEAQRIIEAANCGVCVEPDDVFAIAQAILTLFRDPALQRKLGDSGRTYVLDHYNRKDIAERFETLLVESLSMPSSSIGKLRADSPNQELLESASLHPTIQSKVDE